MRGAGLGHFRSHAKGWAEVILDLLTYNCSIFSIKLKGWVFRTSPGYWGKWKERQSKAELSEQGRSSRWRLSLGAESALRNAGLSQATFQQLKKL